MNNCTYKPSARSSRRCRGDLKDGPKWEEVILDNCPAKSPVTNDLIKLSNVRLCDLNNTIAGECQGPVELSGNLSKLIDSGESITTQQDLEYISIILKGLASHPTVFLANNSKSANKVCFIYHQIINKSIALDIDSKMILKNIWGKVQPLG